MLKDVHTHHSAPQPEGVISATPGKFAPEAGQFYSVGLHPWEVTGRDEGALSRVAELATRADVLAIGETGIDTMRQGAPLFAQINALKRHIEISENVQKPMVLHCVKGHDVICSMRRDLKPTQDWIIHGFRGKPTVARMLLDAGCYLSFGEKFNPASLDATPLNRILAETDESPLSIEEIITRMSEARGMDLTPSITANLSALLFVNK